MERRPYLRTVLDGIRAYLEANSGWKLVMPQYYSGNDQPLDYIPGIIGQISGVPRPEYLQGLLNKGIPTMLIGFSPRPDTASTVVLDYESIAKMAVDHFIEQGVGALAYIGSNDSLKSDHYELSKRIGKYITKLPVSFQEFDNTMTFPGPGLSGQIERIAEWLKRLPAQAGIICGDDDYANRVLLAAHKACLTPGQDFLLLGCGNDRVFCQSANPKVSSIEFDYFGMGWTAAKKLHALVTSKTEVHEELVVRSSVLRVRRSSRRSGSPGGLVARAMDLIWNSYASVSSVDVLTTKLGVNRRTLDRQFRQQLNTSAAQEIREARTEKVKHMLANEHNLLANIAQECGFCDQAHMSREFKRETGYSPLAYRRSRTQGRLA